MYQAMVTTENTTEIYIGLTANNFKARYWNHQMSFRHEKRKSETELRDYTEIIWRLTDECIWRLTEINLSQASPSPVIIENNIN